MRVLEGLQGHPSGQERPLAPQLTPASALSLWDRWSLLPGNRSANQFNQDWFRLRAVQRKLGCTRSCPALQRVQQPLTLSREMPWITWGCSVLESHLSSSGRRTELGVFLVTARECNQTPKSRNTQERGNSAPPP